MGILDDVGVPPIDLGPEHRVSQVLAGDVPQGIARLDGMGLVLSHRQAGPEDQSDERQRKRPKVFELPAKHWSHPPSG